MSNIISVTALNQYVKTLLEHDAVLTDIAISGEISNFVNHYKTGHLYFTLKDEKSSVKAVMFKSDAVKLEFVPENGIKVIVQCRVSLYERDGAFQIYAYSMMPVGVGEKQLALEQLKDKLNKEGLFSEAHKRAIPDMPRCVGLVTSKTGAAIQDIYNITHRRNPMAHFVLYGTNVQGAEASKEIVKAINALNKIKDIDVIIVARGGGSKEDLWVFNDEQIARAAYNSRVPIVSAIGHEIDYSILDFVSDLRAPTPSAAAELVMPDMLQRYAQYEIMYKNMHKCMQRRIALCYNKLRIVSSSRVLSKISSMPQQMQAQLLVRQTSLKTQVDARIISAQKRVGELAARAEALSPYSILARGYGFVQNEFGTVLKDASAVNIGDTVNITLQNGKLECTVENTRSGEYI